MVVDISGSGIDIESEKELMNQAREWHRNIMQGNEALTGWARLPMEQDEDFLCQIGQAADEIRHKCDLLVVVGVGGSYLGAKAVLDALNGSADGCPEVVFAGYNMSASYLNAVIRKLERKKTCMCAISKSGSTLEPMLTYSILREKMEAVYGQDEARKRIYVITDGNCGHLRKDALASGYTVFAVPDDVGGRFSVLSVVGLLPIAVAGHDIRALLAGAENVASDSAWNERLLEYAVVRSVLRNRGKLIEIFEYFEANLRYFGEWLKQLFAESEGKDGKGTYPASLCFSTDLHSIGQFLQQGNQIFYETLIRVENSKHDFVIPKSAGDRYAGHMLEEINACSENGVILAHTKAGIPMVTVQIDRPDEYNMGQLIYFFEMSCAISAYMLGVNPFNQPGVEAYKEETKRLVENLGMNLKKP